MNISSSDFEQFQVTCRINYFNLEGWLCALSRLGELAHGNQRSCSNGQTRDSLVQFSPPCNLKRQVKQQCDIRLYMFIAPVFQSQNFCPLKPSSTTLISVAGITKAVTDHHSPFSNVGSIPSKMFPPCSKHEQCFCFKVHRIIGLNKLRSFSPSSVPPGSRVK